MPIETITNEADLESAGFYWRERDGVRGLICGPLERAGFANAFSTRHGGVSPMPSGALNLAGFNEDTAKNIYENRRRFLKLLNGAWTLASGWQVHGCAIRLIRNLEDAGNDTENCDALTTRTAGILLGVKTADCVSLLLADERSGAVAAVHAGWRGSFARIASQALARMTQEFETRPADVRVAIGPAANACCYEVGSEVIEAFRERLPGMDHLIKATRPGHALIDLQKANAALLSAAGVAPENIHIAPLCTMCSNDLFFSYRREKVAQGRVGRLMAVIGPGT